MTSAADVQRETARGAVVLALLAFVAHGRVSGSVVEGVLLVGVAVALVSVAVLFGRIATGDIHER